MASATLKNSSQQRPADSEAMAAGAQIVAVQAGLVTIKTTGAGPKPLIKNEVVYIVARRQPEKYTERLKAELLRVRGTEADAQVFESTRGVGIGDPVEQTGGLLSVTLGPGLLGRVYDGLQNPLADLATGYGNFLPRGVVAPPLDLERKWPFNPSVKVGDRVVAGSTLGTVLEGRCTHKIMVPFD